MNIIFLILLILLIVIVFINHSNSTKNNLVPRKEMTLGRLARLVADNTKEQEKIFVSIASYRDRDCINTILDCFHKAKYPENVRIGICQQNRDDDIDCVFNDSHDQLLPYLDKIRVIRIPYYEARGPTYARYLCSSLWQGEKYYMQIDSHMRFEKSWDDICLNIVKNMEKKTVLSTYPQAIDNQENDTVAVICNIKFSSDDNVIVYPGASLIKKPQSPQQTGLVAAGFFFADSSFLTDIPFDPHLPDLFAGEEILLSIRFWSHGWDIYAPNENIVYHHYTRKGEPHFWADRKINNTTSLKKVRNLIGLSDEDVPEHLNFRLDVYGLGKIRSLEQFYEFIGFDKNNKTSRKKPL